MKEIWKQIPGCPGYEASTLGRVKSIDRWIVDRRGGRRFYYGRVLTPRVNLRGYCTVKPCPRGTTQVHRLVISAFKGNNSLGVNHINGVKNDNRLSNLEYTTQSENIKHAYKLGLMSAKGNKNGRYKHIRNRRWE